MYAVIINGSPRVKKYSNTDKILEKFVQGFREQGGTCDIYEISDRSQWDKAREAFCENSDIIIALPLYVECVPGLLMEFLETLPPKDTNTKLSFILQGGFAEGAQLRCGERYLEILTEQLGCQYGGTLVKGDNFGIRFSAGKDRDKLIAPYRKMGQIFGRDGNFFAEECRKFTGMEIFPLPLRLFLMVLFKTVQRKRFDKIAIKLGCSRPLDYQPYKR